MDREKLLDRVRKLYAMSRETETSPHEAEIAMRRCQSLMAKFGISEADLETSAFGQSSIGRRFRAIPTYVNLMSSAVGLMHDCICVDTGTIEFRGFSVDAEVASLTYAYLHEAMERSLRSRKRDGSVAPGRSASFDYRVGFAMAVLTRCRKMDQERRAAAMQQAATGGSSTSLVVKKLDIVHEECARNLEKRPRRRVRYRNGEAHHAGSSDGRQVALETQLGGGDAVSGRVSGPVGRLR